VNHRRSALLTAVGGGLLLLSAYFTWSQLQLSAQGQVTDRFTKAVDQLGNKDRHVRLGGIYALERVAKDSRGDRDAISEVLTAYIRGHSYWPGTPKAVKTLRPRLGMQAKDLKDADCPAKTSNQELNAMPLLQVRASDVQAAITVFGRRPYSKTEEGPSLEQIDGRYASFYDADLEDVYFNGSNLQGAVFQDADLDNANFGTDGIGYCRVHSEGADFTDASLEDADLTNAYLDGAIFDGADLSGAKLSGATFKGATADGDTKWPKGFDPEAHGICICDN
jgi:hypothetical protein